MINNNIESGDDFEPITNGAIDDIKSYIYCKYMKLICVQANDLKTW